MKKAVIYSFFVVNLLIISGFWWQSSGGIFGGGGNGAILALGRLAGLLAVYFVLLQFTLVGRSSFIEQTFGLDKLTRIHHWNGLFTIFFIILHPVFITISYAKINQATIIGQFIGFISNERDFLQAFLAVLIFISIIFFSIYIVRRRLKYETWYYIHLGTYLAILLAWGHQLESGGDFKDNAPFVFYWYFLYALVFGNFILWRFARPLFNFYRYRFYVSRIVRETPSAVSIYISGRNIRKFKIIPGQFMIFRFLSKGFFYEAHPFSLSRGRAGANADNDEIRITVKNVGDFTSRMPDLQAGTQVVIDGPYGVFTRNLAERDKFLFIAGGIGITPIRSMIEDAGGERSALIYGNRNENDVVFKNELDEKSRNAGFPVHYVMSDDPGFRGLKGKITVPLISRLVPDFKEREIYMCGPAPMMLSLKKDMRATGIDPRNIHFEQFSLN